MDKYKRYEQLKIQLESQNIHVGVYKEINYGIQFEVTLNEMHSIVRIYESKKKGVSVDLSQVKYEVLKEMLCNISDSNSSSTKTEVKGCVKIEPKKNSVFFTDKIENAMIGVDESGKGDYFGPLVIAGVYADEKCKRILMALGAMDSKKLNDKQIRKLAMQIKEVCIFEVIVIGNERYNKLYNKINNLNKLLGWGHARVIENLLGKVDCQYALSDQFGDEGFIKSALMEKGEQITLEQRPRAEENIVVAAASILAREAFVTEMDKMGKKYNMTFPKGASNATIQAGRRYVGAFGPEKLGEVAKLHFKTTQNI